MPQTVCHACGIPIAASVGTAVRCRCGTDVKVDGLTWHSVKPENVDEAAIVTFHFNPCKFKRQRETFYEWRTSLGPLSRILHTCELILDDDEPEIEGADVVRGTREKHWLWQKESLFNRTLRELPESIKYVAWIDHDIVNHRPTWLGDSIAKIKAGAVAVQMFKTVRFLNRSGSVHSMKYGSVEHGVGCPGGAWLADRKYMDSIGGLWDRNIVGGGDIAFYAGVTGHRQEYIKQHAGKYRQHFEAWVDHAETERNGRPAVSLDAVTSHLYHGDRNDRQYVSREAIVRRHDFDPFTDATVDENGLLTWTESASDELKRDVAEYFAGRREDGRTGKPGTELLAIIPELFKSSGCNCGSYAANMDRWGVSGCENRFDEIVDHLNAEAAKTRLMAYTNPLNRFVARHWLRKAIDAARASEL